MRAHRARGSPSNRVLVQNCVEGGEGAEEGGPEAHDTPGARQPPHKRKTAGARLEGSGRSRQRGPGRGHEGKGAAVGLVRRPGCIPEIICACMIFLKSIRPQGKTVGMAWREQAMASKGRHAMLSHKKKALHVYGMAPCVGLVVSKKNLGEEGGRGGAALSTHTRWEGSDPFEHAWCRCRCQPVRYFPIAPRPGRGTDSGVRACGGIGKGYWEGPWRSG